MNHLVTDEQIASYERDGVVLLRNLFDTEWLEVLAEAIEQNLRQPSKRTAEYVNDPSGNTHFFYDACAVGEVDGYDRLMLESPMGEAVARVMGSSRAIAFYISVFVRSAGTLTPSPWHQDQVNWSAAGNDACSCWMSVDPVPSGTVLEFVSGSHRWETRYQRADFLNLHYENDDQAKLASFPDIESHREDYDIVGWEMEPGDCLVFHGMVAHGGSGNLPPELGRRAVSVQWLGDDARFRIVAGREDPHISEELLRHGIKPGDPVICDMCPVAWPR